MFMGKQLKLKEGAHVGLARAGGSVIARKDLPPAAGGALDQFRANFGRQRELAQNCVHSKKSSRPMSASVGGSSLHAHPMPCRGRRRRVPYVLARARLRGNAHLAPVNRQQCNLRQAVTGPPAEAEVECRGPCYVCTMVTVTTWRRTDDEAPPHSCGTDSATAGHARSATPRHPSRSSTSWAYWCTNPRTAAYRSSRRGMQC